MKICHKVLCRFAAFVDEMPSEIVLAILGEKFDIAESSAGASREDRKLAERIERILLDYDDDELDVAETDGALSISLEHEEWSPADDEASASSREVDPSADTVTFSGCRAVPIESVRKALAYYRETASGTRSLQAMNSSYRFIKGPNDLTKLRRFERDPEACIDRLASIRALALKLQEAAFSKMEERITLHDLQEMARALHAEMKIPRFEASSSWITRFKREYGIVSRRITTFSSRRSLLDEEASRQAGEQFVEETRRIIAEGGFEPHLVVNADQIGLVKQLTSARSLAPRGVRTVERTVQAVRSTTHSYTILPLLYADGHLSPKLFVVLAEKNGQFPRSFRNTAENLVVRSHTSHIMTKGLMVEWIRECVVPELSEKTLLILDHWTSFRDHETIQSLVPDGKSLIVRNIPPGATSRVQPLDVFFFRQFKRVMRRIHEYVNANVPEFEIARRDNILRVLEVVWNQFCHPSYKDFLQYSWGKIGYMQREPVQFRTPYQTCFPTPTERRWLCQNQSECRKLSFMRCSFCEAWLCFDHFFVQKHLHPLGPSQLAYQRSP